MGRAVTLLVLLTFMLPFGVFAASAETSQAATNTNSGNKATDANDRNKKLRRVTPAEEQTVIDSLHSVDPDFPVKGVYESPIRGLLQVEVPGGTLYTSPDGKYMLQGEMHIIENGDVTNLTALERQQGIAKKLAEIPRRDMIIASPNGPTKATVYIFTDTDCGYCRKQHAEVKRMHRYGIEVCWLPYPRAGVDSPAGKQLQAVWSSANRLQAFEQLNAGQQVTAPIKSNPVASFHAMGAEFGINGTPALFLANGEMLPGFQTAKQLAKKLGLKAEPKPSPKSNPQQAAPAA